MCVIQSWPQLSHLTLPAGVRVSSVNFRQVGSNRQFSRLKMVTDNCLQLFFVNFQRMELNYYAHSGGAIRRHSDLILAQRGNTVWWQITWVIGNSVSDVGLQMLISAVSNMNLQIESSTSVTVFCCFEGLNPIKSLNGQLLLLGTWDEPVYILKQTI